MRSPRLDRGSPVGICRLLAWPVIAMPTGAWVAILAITAHFSISGTS
jgi:hypothetical protein